METDRLTSLSLQEGQEGIVASEEADLDLDAFSEGSDDLELRDLEDDYRTGPEPTAEEMGTSASEDEMLQKAVELWDQNQDDEDISSDEENEILKGISDEIKNIVRVEMKDELSEMRQKMEAIESGKVPGQSESAGENETAGSGERVGGGGDSSRINPELKDAIDKMRKLDRILQKKVKKERQVKRSRLLLEKRMREEIDNLEHGGTNYREIKTNTERFLALAPPPSHNNGISIEEDNSEEEAPPLFSTQIYDVEGLFDKPQTQQSTTDDAKEQNENDNQTYSSRSRVSGKGGKGGKGKKHKKDFIRRNKELAADADQVVAMTDDEKKRLQDLLGDVDQMADGEETLLPLDDAFQGGAFQVSRLPGDGFRPDNIESASLTNIDARLRHILPDDSYKSLIDSGVLNSEMTLNPPTYSHVPFLMGGDIPERFGEKVLYDTKEERELKAKLEAIEDQLSKFKTQDSQADGQTLTDDQLDSLLTQCVHDLDLSRMSDTSRLSLTSDLVTPDLSARSFVSSRQSLSELEIPRLTEAQLQQLLSEAHFPLSSSLLSNQNDDEKIEEKKGNTEIIQAETWKAISEENVEKSNPDDDITNGDNDIKESNETDQTENNSNVYDSKNISRFSPSDKINIDNISYDGEENFSSPEPSPARGSKYQSRELLPKINTNLSAWASFSSESTPVPSVTPPSSVHQTRDIDFGSADPLRLPDIQSNCFLVQAPQGMNNETGKSGDNLSRKPIQRLHNNLTESLSSVHSYEDESLGSRTANSLTPQFVPRPPTKESSQTRLSSRP